MYSGVEKEEADGFSANVTRVRERGFPVFGTSDIRDKGAVKKAGARWHPDRKKWVAYTLEALEQLIETKKWKPDRVDSHEYRQLVDAFRHGDTAPSVSAAAKKAKARAQEPDLVDKAAREEALLKEMLCIPKDEDDVKKWLLEQHGVDEQRIASSATDHTLGPRGGISAALRFKRAILLQQHHGARIFQDDFFFFQQEKRTRERDLAEAESVADALAAHGFDPTDENFEAELSRRRRDMMHAPLTDEERWQIRRCAGVPLLLEYLKWDIMLRRHNTLPCDWDARPT